MKTGLLCCVKKKKTCQDQTVHVNTRWSIYINTQATIWKFISTSKIDSSLKKGGGNRIRLYLDKCN